MRGGNFNFIDILNITNKEVEKIEDDVFKVANVRLEGEKYRYFPPVATRGDDDMTCLSYRLSLTEIRAFEAGRSSRAALKECHLTKDGSSWFVKKVSLPPFDVEIFEVVKRKGLEAITPEFYFDVSQVCYSSSFSRSTFFFISYFH